ncbi:MAG TPA: hypothetical protein VGJ00_08305 [Rhabdochlamydiaceae bacterium]|jgi:hypothetical protein
MAIIQGRASSTAISISQSEKYTFYDKHPTVCKVAKWALYAFCATIALGAIVGVTHFGSSTVPNLFDGLDYIGMTSKWGAVGYSVGSAVAAYAIPKLLGLYFKTNGPESAFLPSNKNVEIPLIKKAAKFYKDLNTNHPNALKYAKYAFFIAIAAVMITALIGSGTFSDGFSLAESLGMDTTRGVLCYVAGSIAAVALWKIIKEYLKKNKCDDDDYNEMIEHENKYKTTRYYNSVSYETRIKLEKILLEEIILDQWTFLDAAKRKEILGTWKISKETDRALSNYQNPAHDQTYLHIRKVSLDLERTGLWTELQSKVGSSGGQFMSELSREIQRLIDIGDSLGLKAGQAILHNTNDDHLTIDWLQTAASGTKIPTTDESFVKHPDWEDEGLPPNEQGLPRDTCSFRVEGAEKH